MVWLANEDRFTNNVQQSDDTEIQLTKRIILKKKASIFGPHGFIGPYIICARVLM